MVSERRRIYAVYYRSLLFMNMSRLRTSKQFRESERRKKKGKSFTAPPSMEKQNNNHYLIMHNKNVKLYDTYILEI